MQPFRRHHLQRRANPPGDMLDRLDLPGPQIQHAEDHVLAPAVSEQLGLVPGLLVLDADLVRAGRGDRLQRAGVVRIQALVADGRVSVAHVHGLDGADAVERGVQGPHPPPHGRVVAEVEVRLVQLDDVESLGLQGAQLLVDRLRHRHAERLLVRVVVVGKADGGGERPDDGHLHRAAGVSLQKPQVVEGHRLLPADLADDTGGHGFVQPLLHGRIQVDEAQVAALHRPPPERLVVQALEAEEVGVEPLAPLLAVGDDVQPGTLLIGDGQPGGIVLAFREHVRIRSPERGAG